jgi:hypothetical protein
MTSIERTAYPRLKRRPSAQELADVYTPTTEDLAFIRAHGARAIANADARRAAQGLPAARPHAMPAGRGPRAGAAAQPREHRPQAAPQAGVETYM